MPKIKNDKKEIVFELSKKIINELSIEDIIASRIDIKKPLCPFHNDKHSGSFQISDAKGIFKCFSCGESGNAIRFIQKFDNIRYSEAVLRIALEFGLIEKDQFDKLANMPWSTNVKSARVVKRVFDEDMELNPNINNYIYRLFISISPLSKEHRKYLNDRGINDEEIRESMYFSMPDLRKLPKLKTLMEQRDINEEELIGVPGFYRDNKKNKVVYVSYRGIGIPLKDTKDRIIGIQVRRDKITDNESRYIFFSSTFANNPELKDISDGTSSGTILDVIKTSNKLKENLYITEGHFKAQKIYRTLNTPVVSVQGVGNFKGVEKIINELKDEYPLKRICIAYDADLIYNPQVYKHLYKLSEKCAETKLPVYITTWSPRYGKGIDDVINSGNMKEVKNYSFDKFIEIIRKYSNELRENKINFNDKMDIKKITEIFEKQLKGL